jgi:hypothetical protein
MALPGSVAGFHQRCQPSLSPHTPARDMRAIDIFSVSFVARHGLIKTF